MYVEKCSDELWLGVKRLTNSAIAGSPRNIFRYSPDVRFREVEILKEDAARKGTHFYQTPNARNFIVRSQCCGEISWHKRETTHIIS